MSLDTLRTSPPKSKALNIALWIVQILLGLNFLFAGGMKVVSPIAELMKMIPAPGALIRFIGVAEFAGGLGLLLPSLLRIKPWLTPLAAGGLVIILSGATGMGVVGGKLEPALTPFAIMLFAGFVAIGRSRWIPLEEKTRKIS